MSLEESQVQDLDAADDEYPVAGSVEDKLIYSIQQQRRKFFLQKKVYLLQREGGARYNSILRSYGLKTATEMAENTERGFTWYLTNNNLTVDGETTDPRIPVDKMINHELRRIRTSIVNAVNNFFYVFEPNMPEELRKWSYALLAFHLHTFSYIYMTGIYDEINIVIPEKKMPPRNAYEVAQKLEELAMKYQWETIQNDGHTRDFVIERLRDELIEFLLVELPYNNKQLSREGMMDELRKTAETLTPQAVDAFIEKRVNEEAVAKKKEEEDKPIIH